MPSPLDMSLQPPAQELVAKDLLGNEWRFRHISRGQPRRHLLQSGRSLFVSAKKLVAGDAFIFLRGESGELRVGVRRAMRQANNSSSSVISSHSMHIGILATAWHAVSTGTMFTVYYKPRTNPAEFIIPVDKYVESLKNNFAIGMRIKMRFEAEEAPEQQFSGTVIGVEHADPKRWPDLKWRCLKVHWDETSPVHCPNRVSPWELKLALVPSTDPLPTCRVKRFRPNMTMSSPDSSIVAKKDNGLSRDPKDQEIPTSQSTLAVNNHSDVVRQPSGWNPSQAKDQNSTNFDKRRSETENENPQAMTGVKYINSAPGQATPHVSHEFASKLHSSPSFNEVHGVEVDYQPGSWILPMQHANNSARLAALELPPLSLKPRQDKAKENSLCKLFGISLISNPVPKEPDVIPENFICRPQRQFNPTSNNLQDLGSDLTLQPSEYPKFDSYHFVHSKLQGGLTRCVKVHKQGIAVGKSVDLAMLNGYNELIVELDQMFEFNGELIHSKQELVDCFH